MSLFNSILSKIYGYYYNDRWENWQYKKGDNTINYSGLFGDGWLRVKWIFHIICTFSLIVDLVKTNFVSIVRVSDSIGFFSDSVKSEKHGT